ncbi:MAG: glycosyltransferase [Lactobacillaceae bacterium]|jgi:poly(glycerol-phosphate) alpha-glucosyltransferase|nr:glycosyltransferase [Lactobacillaceae bacterium]
MIFFINDAIQENKSGIEHAQNKRAKLFESNNEPFKLLYRQWQPKTHTIMENDGFNDDQFINMFDYYQDTLNTPRKNLYAQDLDFGVADLELIEEPQSNRFIAQTQTGQLVARINYRFDQDKIVNNTELFDGFGNLYRVDWYDDRGFKSLSQLYTPDNKIGSEIWSRLDGTIAIETFNRFNVKGELVKTGWRLNLSNNESQVFANLDELTGYWLNDLNEKYFSLDKPNIFILDRSHVGDWQLKYLESPAYIVLHLHNAQTGDAQHPQHSVLNNFYEYPLFNLDTYDAVISATQKQNKDVDARFKPKAKLFTIPVGIVPDSQLKEERIPMKDRTFGKVIATARIANEKRLDLLVRAVGEAKKKVPEITLDIYGYADGSNNFQARRNVEEAIKDYQLEGAVRMMGYTDDVAKVQKDAQIYGLTSTMEGFNLAILEASSRGDVGVTYDVNYGPNEIIVDGENGKVVPYDDWHAIADALVDYLTNPDKLQAASDKAYELSARYSAENVWKAWQSLIDDAQENWPNKTKNYKPVQKAQTI